MEAGLEAFLLYIADVQKVNTSSLQDLVTLNFYNQTTKELDLTTIGNYDNEGYQSVKMDIEGNWPLNTFAIKVNATNGLSAHVWSDNNDFTFRVTNEIINADFLRKLGWADNEAVWGIELYGSSPDEFWGTATCKDYNTKWTINSSWFVLEWRKIRGKQYRAVLKRDVIADNYNQVVAAPVYIQKANIKDPNDPLIFNSEGMAFNQIKQSETPLKDETGCGWVVGYIPSDWAGGTIQSNVVINSAQANIEVNGLANWSYWKNVTSNSNFKYMSSSSGDNKVGLKVRWRHTEIGYSDSYVDFYGQMIYFNTSSGYLSTTTLNTSGQDASSLNWPGWADSYHITGPTTAGWYYKTELEASERNALINQFTNSTFRSYVNTVIGQGTEVQSASTVQALRNLGSQIIKDTSTNTYYRIDIVTVNEANPITPDVNTTAGYNVINYVRNGVSNASGWSSNGTITTGDVVVQLSSDAYAINLTQISIDCETTINTDRYHLSDNPYDMFCIPFSDTLQIYDGTDTFTCSKDVALNIAEHLAKSAGSDSIYDVQLLPYCPARHIISGSSNPGRVLDVTKGKYNHINTVSDGQVTGHISTIIWCMSSTFTFDINHYIYAPTANATELKVANECDMYRLSSGNFNGMFEFSPAKSYGVNGFKVECTYKPFNPYIHVTPKLKGLYGTNYTTIDDMRGLICGGDFSLPQLSNAWANYELQNKNYENIFYRQIQNLDVQYDVAKTQAIVSSIAGVFTGGATGAGTGAMMGAKAGPYGAIAGAAIGGTVGMGASIAGGVADYQNLTKLQQENIDFQTDLYHYNLQNIQAIPSSLAKSSALTFNTRVWPFLEYYTCTETEKNAFRNKLKYNGMTVMKIDNINNYIYDDDYYFLQGQLIRLDSVNGESGIVAEIYNELFKGVFI